jgi:hypothetical protein
MAILFSGDFHANEDNELCSITRRALLRKFHKDLYNSINYHIILGDGGFDWPNNGKTDNYNYKALACRPFPILCVQGDSEPYLFMPDGYYLEKDIGIGEKVDVVNEKPFVAFLKRGKVYNIDGFKFLVLGSARSVNNFRSKKKIGGSFDGEGWTPQEKFDVMKLIETENSFDCVLSHTGPNDVNKWGFWGEPHELLFIIDDIAIMNEEIRNKIKFKMWWCGHWHMDRYYNDGTAEYRYLYREPKILGRKDGRMVVNE